MSVETIRSHRPLWICKLSNEKLREYLDAANEYELNGYANELLLDAADAWYHNDDKSENLSHLVNDIYKTCAVKWYDSSFE